MQDQKQKYKFIHKQCNSNLVNGRTGYMALIIRFMGLVIRFMGLVIRFVGLVIRCSTLLEDT